MDSKMNSVDTSTKTIRKIHAKVISLQMGYEHFRNLKGIMIKSSKYNILIMEDYLPVIGEVIGDVTLIGDDFQKKYEGIHGFYKHSGNEFELLLKEQDDR